MLFSQKDPAKWFKHQRFRKWETKTIIKTLDLGMDLFFNLGTPERQCGQDLITKKCHSKVQFGHWHFFSTLDGRPKTAIHAFPGHFDDMVIFSDAYILTRWPIFKAWQKLTDCNMLTTIHQNRGNLINIFIKSFFRSPFSWFHRDSSPSFCFR